uniref:Complement C1q subcomponent subunit B-like n=1 Tax=Crassostrea virginica TaxID=6565 RepID=A0A8B8BFP1_CRAVI|nr:complement C1q subcomponent subunit B-like [Crassostrea virginica]
MMKFTDQTQCTDTTLTSLKNLVIDNSRTTVTFNPTALRTLIALSNSEKMPSIEAKTVCFSANSRAKDRSLRAGQTVIFDEVLTNEGNGYDYRTGEFTCPVAGNYMFVVDSHSYGSTWLHVFLNKKAVASLHAPPSGSYSQMSRTVILKLKKGDHVKVVNHLTATGVVYNEGYSGFSGTKLI